jgi:hypothetical protein
VVDISGGEFTNGLFARNDAIVNLRGGLLEQSHALSADDNAVITVVGGGLKVDGVPVPFGDLEAETGVLTGTLSSGDPINSAFYQGGGSYTGTIRLTHPPLPAPALSTWGYSALISCLLALGLVALAAGRGRG